MDFETILVWSASATGPDIERAIAPFRQLRIRVVKSKSHSLASMRNAGGLAAQSEYILFLNYDDLPAKTALEKLLILAAVNPDKEYFQAAVSAPSPTEGFPGVPLMAARDGFRRAGGYNEGKRIGQSLVALNQIAHLPEKLFRSAVEKERPASLQLPDATKSYFSVLYCIPFCPVGGAERVDLDILSGLSRDKFRVTLVTMEESDNPWLSKFEEKVFEVFLMPHFHKDTKKVMDVLLYLCMARNVDLIFNRNTSPGYALAKTIKGITSTVATADLLHLQEGRGDWVETSATYHNDLDARFVISKALRGHMTTTYGFPDADFTVIYNGVDTSRELSPAAAIEASRRIRREFLIPADAPIMTFVGRLAPQKDPVRWINVAALIAAQAPSLHFLIVGDGELRPEIEQILRELPIADRFHLAGYREDVDAIYAATTITLFTSRNEGLPLVLQESMLQGAPVVATSVGAIEEGLNDSVGELVASDASDEEVARAALRLLQRLDADNSIRSRCKEHVRRHFSLGQMQAAYGDVFARLCAKDSSRRAEDYRNWLMSNWAE
jgi:glycosyltransferase involved in cell wall biosynthesis